MGLNIWSLLICIIQRVAWSQTISLHLRMSADYKVKNVERVKWRRLSQLHKSCRAFRFQSWPEPVFQLYKLSYPSPPPATFLFYFSSVVDWLTRPLASLISYRLPFLLVWLLSPQAGNCVMNVDSPQSPPEDSCNAKHSSAFRPQLTPRVWKRHLFCSTADTAHHQLLLSKDSNKEKPSLKHQMTLSWISNAGHVWLCQWLFCNFVLCV